MSAMTRLKRIVRLSLTALALATAGLAIGAYRGGASGADRPPAPASASLPALNCTAAPPGVSAADWCPAN